jgi:hypothetical protein
MQCILYKIYFWKVFHKYYNLICIFICTPICTKFYSCKKWVLQASCCSNPHSKLSELLSTLKNGKLRSASFAMNRFNAAILPVSLCTSLMDYEGFIFTMTLILSGLALIPFIDTRQPRTLPLHILTKASTKSCI